MELNEKVNYDGHKLDVFPNYKLTTLTRRVENGEVTKKLSEGWIEVTLQSGIKVVMSEERMKIACGIE